MSQTNQSNEKKAQGVGWGVVLSFMFLSCLIGGLGTSSYQSFVNDQTEVLIGRVTDERRTLATDSETGVVYVYYHTVSLSTPDENKIVRVLEEDWNPDAPIQVGETYRFTIYEECAGVCFALDYELQPEE